MTVQDITIPNLLGGVSRQAPEVRYPNQVTAMTNMVADPVHGLHKRPNTVAKYKSTLGSTGDDTLIARHVFQDSQGSGRYMIIAYDNFIKHARIYMLDIDKKAALSVIDKNNIPFNISNYNGVLKDKYTTASDLEFMTIGDVVYVFDKNKKIEMGTTVDYPSGGSPQNAPYVGFIWIKSGAYSSAYDIEINGQRNTVTTKGSLHDATADARNAERGADVKNITSALYDMIKDGTKPSNTLYVPSPSASRVTGVTFRLAGNVIWMYSQSPITITNHGSQTNVNTAVNTVAQISDLPPLTGYNWGNDQPYITVAGDNTKAEDDYVMRYIDGVWQESVPPNSTNSIENNAIVMFRKEFDDKDNERWRVTEMEFAKRKVGDDVTNPRPSFLGQNITGLFTHNNRFGIISGESLIMAESGEFLAPNFWNKTTLTSLDTDPIDIAVATDEVNAIHNVVQLSKNLLAFSDKAQFVLDGDTPLNTRFYRTTTYDNSPDVKPIAHGQFVYFVDKQNNVWEMATNNITDTTAAVDISEHVSGYVSSPIKQIIGDTENKIILFRADDDVYTYKYHYTYTPQGIQKQQSAWGRWDFKNDVDDIFKIGGDLYMLSAVAIYTYIDSMVLDGHNKLTMLDRMGKYTRSGGRLHNDIFADMTILDKNYKVVTRAQAEGSGYADGDEFYAGYPYTAAVELSPLYIKGKPQLGVSYKRMFITYEDTAYFEVVVDYKGRTQTQVFNNRFLNAGQLDRVATGDGTFEMINFGDNKHTKITITSVLPYNYSIQGITHQCRLTERRGG